MTAKLHPIESYFIGRLETADIPNIDNLGGLTTIFRERMHIANSRIADEILRAVLDATTGDDATENTMVAGIFKAVFQKNDDAITLREIVRLFSSRIEILKVCFQDLLELARDNTRPGILRRYYLAAAFEVALDDHAKKHTLIGYLLETSKNENSDYVAHLIKIIGLSFTFFDQEELFKKLETFETSNNEEKFFELGMGWLHKALNAYDRSDSLTYFEHSLKNFNLAAELGREDASNYAIAISILLRFNAGESITKVQPLIARMHRGVISSAAWDPIDTALSWTSLRNTELLNWNLLTVKLDTLLKSLDEVSWFEPSIIIEEFLLKIYTSSRSILNSKPGTGFDQLIQPLIRQRLADKNTQVYLLDKWLLNKRGHELWPVGELLSKQIQEFKAGRQVGNELGTTGELSIVVPTYNALSNSKKNDFQTFFTEYKDIQEASTSKVVIAIFEKLTNKLAEVPSFHDNEVGMSFKVLLYWSLIFLKLRMDNTRKNHPAMKYLYKMSKHPHEKELQLDYYTFMCTQPNIGEVNVEISDIASGRADVIFNFTSYRFCTEVKRELVDCSFDNLSTLHMGQAKEYANTSSKLGILLVLDLTDKSHGIGSFESNVKLEICSTVQDPLERAIVMIKVPGNRLTPSAVKQG